MFWNCLENNVNFAFHQVGGECEPRGMALNYLLAGWYVCLVTFSPQGVYSQYTWCGVRRSFILQTPKICEPEILCQKNTWLQNVQPPKNTRRNEYPCQYWFLQLNRLIDRKKYDRSLDPKKYQGWKFSTPKNTSDPPPACILQVPPLEFRHFCYFIRCFSWTKLLLAHKDVSLLCCGHLRSLNDQHTAAIAFQNKI